MKSGIEYRSNGKVITRKPNYRYYVDGHEYGFTRLKDARKFADRPNPVGDTK